MNSKYRTKSFGTENLDQLSKLNVPIVSYPSKKQNHVSVPVKIACLNVQKSHQILQTQNPFLLKIDFFFTEPFFLKNFFTKLAFYFVIPMSVTVNIFTYELLYWLS